MACLNIGDLPLPRHEFDPEFAPLDDKGKKRFEKTVDAVAEETTRISLLRRQHRKRSNLVDNDLVQALAKRLSKRRARPTLASARYLHDQRRRIVGALWKVVCDAN